MSGAPNLTPDQRAALRAKLAGEITAAHAALTALVDRDASAEKAVADVEKALVVVRTRRVELVREMEAALQDPGMMRPMRPIEAIVADLNAVDEELDTGDRAKARSSSELGTARAERAKASETLETLRRRLLDLVVGGA